MHEVHQPIPLLLRVFGTYLVLLGDGVERGEELLEELPAAPAADHLDVLSYMGDKLD